MPEARSRDRSFGPAVLAGLAGATLAAVAGARTWATAEGDAAGVPVDATVSGTDAQPLVAALALVALAAWGVVLVLRGRVRRVVAGVGLLAALGALLATVLGFDAAQDAAVEAAIAQGASDDTVAAELSAWIYLSGMGAVLTAAAFAVAVLRSPGWPAMGSRYDAPTGSGSAPATPASEEDMWRALDEGRDPTS
jgi:uncharacterized membrane protein (TIGR02234 family)